MRRNLLIGLAWLGLSTPVRAVALDGEPPPSPADSEPPAGVSSAEGSAGGQTSPVEDQQTLLLDIKSQLAALNTHLGRAERRVAVLKEAVLGGPIIATSVVLVHRNEVGGPFALDRATYMLDGGVIFEQTNANGRLEEQKIFELFNGGLTPGPHQLRVFLEFRGRARGPFTYLEGYGFRVKSGCNFEVVEGRAHRIDVVAAENRNAGLEPQDRLSVRCDVREDRSPKRNRVDPGVRPAGGASSAENDAAKAPRRPARPDLH